MAELVYAIPVEPGVPPRAATVVNRLDAAALPEGKTRLFVELVGDGLATGIRVPVVAVRGTRPGPVFGITACVHGNELNGIPVIHEIFRRLDPEEMTGTVVGVVAVNVPGFHANRREFTDGTDLNRIMPGREGGTVSQVYANRILTRLVNQFTHLVDLHTASFGRVNSLYVRADMTDPRTAAMAYLQNPEIIVHNAASDHTVRGAAMAMGIPAITVEIGDPQTWQRRYTESTVDGLWAVLGQAGVVAAAPAALGPEPILCASSAWMYTDLGGLLEVFPAVMEPIHEGERVARVMNAFGDVIREYAAPSDGIVVGRSVNPVGQTGSRILHLGALAPPDHGFVRRA